MPLVFATKIDKPFISNINDILNKKIAIVKGSVYKDRIKVKYPYIKFIEVSNTKKGLEKVNEDKAYAFIGILPIIGFNIQKHFVGNLKIAGKLDSQVEFSMATRNDEPLLHSIFSKLINSIPEEKNRNITDRWLSVTYEKSVNYTMIFYVISIFIIIFFFIITKNRAINTINKELSDYIRVIDEHVLTSTTDSKGNINSVSQAFCNISGYTKEELLGKNHRFIHHPDMSEKLFTNLWKTITSGKTWKGEIKNKKKNGDFYWIKAIISPIFDTNSKIVGYTAIRHDITDKKRIEEIAITDELTSLYNKRHFNHVFEKELTKAQESGKYFGLIILDIDFFKQYNDTYGHQEGDNVLQNMGTCLRSLCDLSSCTPFRIGGEEFAIIFTPNTKEDAKNFAKIINKKIEDMQLEHKKNKASEYITASIGLYVESDENLSTTEDIYRFADTAMYTSKSNGRNQFTLYNK